MTKKKLIEALKPYPDDSKIVTIKTENSINNVISYDKKHNILWLINFDLFKNN